MISRIHNSNSKELYMQKWFPRENVNLNMNYFVIAEKPKLVKYVLHAKHSSALKKGEDQNLKALFKEDFITIWEAARASLQ
jgi:hypothetical protein